MSAFEVAVTPPRIQNARKVSAIREPTQVILAPFSAKSIVAFEDIPVTKTAKRYVHIHNPTDNVLKVLITRTIKPEANVMFEWTSNEIAARGYVSLELVWSPQVEWATREVIQFTDNRNFKKDVAVVLKCVDKTAKNLLKKVMSSSRAAAERPITRKLVIKSPSPRTKQRARLAAATLNANKRNAAILTSTENQIRNEAKMMKNILRSQNSGLSNGAPSSLHATTADLLPDDTDVQGKENIQPTPCTPSNVSSIFDSIRFTPLSVNKPNDGNNVDYLASLPTPTRTPGASAFFDRMEHVAMQPLDNTYEHVNEDYEGPLDLSRHSPIPQTQLNNQTTNLSDMQTPRLNRNWWSPSQIPPEAHRTPIDFSRRAPVHREHVINQTTILNEIQTPHSERNFKSASQNMPEPIKTPVIVYNHQHNGASQKLSTTFELSPQAVSRSPRSPRPSSPYHSRTIEHAYNEHMTAVNRTRLLSPAGDHLYVIEEELTQTEMSETFVKHTQHERTFNVIVAPDNLARDVSLVASPLKKKFQSLKDLNISNSNLSLEQQILRCNQGSMPNLHKLDKVKSIENNRYFYQSIEKDLPLSESNELGANASMYSMQNGISTLSVAFQEHEILAQSSVCNINEIGRTRPATSNDGVIPSSVKYFIDSNDALHTAPTPPVTSGVFAKPQPVVRNTMKPSESLERPSVITPTSRSFSSGSTQKRTRRVDFGSTKSLNKESPPKRVRLGLDFESPSPHLPKGQSFRTKTWGDVQAKKFRIPKVPIHKLVLKKPQEKRVILYDPDLHLRGVINPDPFAATTTLDPFLSATMFLDERCVDTHEIHFKKWLNALVATPEEMEEQNQKLDFGKLFNEVKNKDIALAPTKETVSSNYLTKSRLNNLRQTAIELYTSNEMREILEKLLVHIERKSIQIRRERNLHQDVVLQREILELLLNFNPLWLRLGLEVVFGEQISMQNNHDIVSLSSFILNRLFRDKYMESKHSKVYAQSEAYAEYIKKFTLKKFLCLLCFLDAAKNQKIIKHNPCLFLKSSTAKMTKDILLKFSSSLLGNIGDIQRELKRLGIFFTHTQTYIDEFDYAFRNLAIDLRDGVRLTKVMEIIMLREDLTCQLRVPAISRTQRIHNVGVALKALQSSGFVLTGNITPADIADGHREKTLSLLWQIIYIFRAPKFNAAAGVIQKWWRKNSLKVCIKHRIRQRHERVRHNAAAKIQAVWRGYQSRRFVREYSAHRNCAALIIQTYYRRFLAIKHTNYKMNCIVYIQRWYKGINETIRLKRKFQLERRACIKIQRWYRASMVMQMQRHSFIERKDNVLKIQTWFRACQLAKVMSSKYRVLRKATIIIQTRLRAQLQMKESRNKYLTLRRCAINIQRRFRAQKHMIAERKEYTKVHTSIIIVQTQWKAMLLMRKERTTYIRIKTAAITIQTYLRATLECRRVRHSYITLKKSAICFQQQYHALIAMRKQRDTYKQLKRVTINIQRRFRANEQMKLERKQYLQGRNAAIVFQRQWRALVLMQQIRKKYLERKKSAIVFQRQFRAMILMKQQRAEYLRLLNATRVFQSRYRALLAMRIQRKEYENLRKACICFQQRFRAKLRMISTRSIFTETKVSALCIQSHWKAILAMRRERKSFVQIKTATICIQQHLRATLKMRLERQKFLLIKTSSIVIQQRYRATILARHKRVEFLIKRRSIISIQKFYKGFKQMQVERKNYLTVQIATITLQQRWRAYRLMTIQKEKYRTILRATKTIQAHYRATKLMETQQKIYTETRKKIIKIQRFFRSYLEMKRLRKEFLQKRASAICLQRQYRAILQMRQTVNQYKLIRSLVICLQQKFRAKIQMQVQREKFLQTKRAAIVIQQAWHAKKMRDEQHKRYNNLKSMTILLQARIRGKQARQRFQALMTPEMVELRKQTKAAKTIQAYWRGYNIRRKRTKKMVAICENAKKLQQNVIPRNTLRFKIQGIIRFLKTRYNVNEALCILRELEFISRTVPHTLIDESIFIASFCYGIMKQAIRSEVDKQIIGLCCRVLLNLARYEPTKENAFQISQFETVAHILLRWCDKDCDIFNILCTVIWVFVQCPIKNEKIREFMFTHEALFLLRETKKNVERKENMKRNVKHQFSSTLMPRELRKLPMLETNFGVNTCNNYIFNSSIFGFETVLTKLNINLQLK